jgi:hypothetical protein
VAFVWVGVDQETINLPLGCLQGDSTGERENRQGRHAQALPLEARNGHIIKSVGS